MRQIGKIINGKFVPFADIGGGGKIVLPENKVVVTDEQGNLSTVNVSAEEVGFLAGLSENVQKHIDDFTKKQVLNGNGSYVILQKLGTFVLAYIYKTPAMSIGEKVKIGDTDIILGSSCPITVGTSVLYSCFFEVKNGEVTITNTSGKEIANVYYKGFAILS